MRRSKRCGMESIRLTRCTTRLPRSRHGKGCPPSTGRSMPSWAAGYQVPLDWMPAYRYRPYWHQMRMFALPSFFDGCIRINLKGRERRGTVPLDGYHVACDEAETLLRECIDPETGQTVVDE